MNNFYILAVLAILAYMVYSNVQRIRANRQEARDKERNSQANWETFNTALSNVRAQKPVYLARAADLPEEERSHRWQTVQNNIVMACNAFLSHDFPRAMAYVLVAQQKADTLLTA